MQSHMWFKEEKIWVSFMILCDELRSRWEEVSSVRSGKMKQCGLKIERTTSPTGSNNSNSNACGGWGNKETTRSMRSLLDWCAHTKTKKNKFCCCCYCDACYGQPTRCTFTLTSLYYFLFIIVFILYFQVRRIFELFQQNSIKSRLLKAASYIFDIGRSVVQTSFIFTIGFCCCVIMLLLYFVWE